MPSAALLGQEDSTRHYTEFDSENIHAFYFCCLGLWMQSERGSTVQDERSKINGNFLCWQGQVFIWQHASYRSPGTPSRLQATPR